MLVCYRIKTRLPIFSKVSLFLMLWFVSQLVLKGEKKSLRWKKLTLHCSTFGTTVTAATLSLSNQSDYLTSHNRSFYVIIDSCRSKIAPWRWRVSPRHGEGCLELVEFNIWMKLFLSFYGCNHFQSGVASKAGSAVERLWGGGGVT